MTPDPQRPFRPKATFFRSLILMSLLALFVVATRYNPAVVDASDNAPGSAERAAQIFLDSLLAEPNASDPTGEAQAATTQVVRAFYTNDAQLDIIAQFADLLETEWDRDVKSVLLIASAETQSVLGSAGITIQLDPLQTAQLRQFQVHGQRGIPGYACYRTVEETYTTAADLASTYPTLASWIDIGDSWAKTNNPAEGYDIMVLKITNSAIPGPKPGLFAMSSVHAREYTPAELNTRFAEHLLTNYGTDPDITWIVDHTEIHLVLQANPDSRKIAETGKFFRKNSNENFCSGGNFYADGGNHGGIDLNRNFPYTWRGCANENCSSSLSCSAVFRGPSAGSEPETKAITDYLTATFPDNRADGLSAAAPDDAQNIFFDIHSFSELVLWPWGFSGDTGNGPALQTFGRKLANFNGYEPTRSDNLYPTDGTTIDFAYGELGMASYVFELGTSFFQGCSAFEATIFPRNLDALVYAAKAARAPYQLPAGPDVEDVGVSVASVEMGTTVKVGAKIDDGNFNISNGAEPTQAISAAEYYIDELPWDAGATAYPMGASDGNFDTRTEDVNANVDTSTLSVGQHTLYVRGQDADGNWGVVSAVYINVTEPQTTFYNFLPMIQTISE